MSEMFILLIGGGTIAERGGGVEEGGVESPRRDIGTTFDGLYVGWNDRGATIGDEILYAESLLYKLLMRFIVEK